MHMEYFRKFSVFLFSHTFTVTSVFVFFFSHACLFCEAYDFLPMVTKKLFWLLLFLPPDVGRTWIQTYEKYIYLKKKKVNFTFLTEWNLNNTCKKEKGSLFEYKELTLSKDRMVLPAGPQLEHHILFWTSFSGRMGTWINWSEFGECHQDGSSSSVRRSEGSWACSAWADTASGAPNSSLPVPMGRLLKTQSQALHRGTWWEDEGQWPHVEVKEVKIKYKE